MLVHAPVACWTLTPFSDLAAVGLAADFFWQVSALLLAVGVGVGALAATAGAMDYPRGHAKAPKLVLAHACLMSAAWMLAAISLLGRLDAAQHPLLPPPTWAIAVGVLAFLTMAAGAWCGGEMVYGRGVGVRAIDQDPQAR